MISPSYRNMGRIPPQPPRPEFPPNTIGDNDPGPAEPNWKGVLKVAGLVSIVLGCGIIFICFVLFFGRVEHHTEQIVSQDAVCRVQYIYNEQGGWEFQKLTFEGHAYATSAGRAFTHLESCPCKKTKAEQ